MSNKKTGIAILSIMGFLWCLAGAVTLPPAWRLAGTVGALIITGALLYANASQPPALTRLNGKIFGLAVAFEVVGIAAAIRFLIETHEPTFILTVIAVIVGLHFIGMWLATDNRAYLGITVAMCGAGLISALLAPPARMQVAGLASGVILWAGAVQGIMNRPTMG